MSIRRAATTVLATFALVPVLGVGTGWAASPSERECTANGGTFDRTNGTVTCTITTSDPVGNSENSDGKSQTRDRDTTDGGQGNLNNKETEESCVSGPGNQTTC